MFIIVALARIKGDSSPWALMMLYETNYWLWAVMIITFYLITSPWALMLLYFTSMSWALMIFISLFVHGAKFHW